MRGPRAAALVVLFILTGCSDQIVSPQPGPSLVAIHATWCQPCQRDKPLLAEVAKEFPVTEIDIDSQRQLAARYSVTSLPTYIVMYGGQEIGRTNDLRSALNTLRSFNQLRQ